MRDDINKAHLFYIFYFGSETFLELDVPLGFVKTAVFCLFRVSKRLPRVL